MKLGIISDTHDQVELTEQAVAALRQEHVDRTYHLGDWCSPFMLQLFADAGPVFGVFGNNDADVFKHQAAAPANVRFYDRFLEEEIDRKKLAFLHGDPVHIVDTIAKSGSYDVVFHGHTHMARIERVGATLIMNPGSLVKPFGRQKNWTNPSVGVYETTTGEARLIKL
jgi:uncharacterized protein